MDVLLNEQDSRARLGHVGRTKLYELLGSGELESVKIGRRRLIVAASIDRFVERLQAQQAKEATSA